MSENRDSSGSFAAEVLVATLVAAAVIVPLLTLLFQERDTEQRSRFEYAALLAARDEICECRMALAAGARPESLAHDWRPLTGNPFERLSDASPGLAVDVTYAAEQARVATRVTLEPGAGGRLRLATVTARWLDPETQRTPGGRERPTSLKLVFGLFAPGWNR